MPTRIIDGLSISTQIKNELKQNLVHKATPKLAVILPSDNPASEVYVRKKQQACDYVGIDSQVHMIKDGILEKIRELNNDKSVNGILVQLPLPKDSKITRQHIFDEIDPAKDVDCFTPTNTGLLLQGRPRFIPCTPYGIQEMLRRSHIETSGKKIVIINRSDIVGKPLAALLIQDSENANATVCICHDMTTRERLVDDCIHADIIVVAVGIPDFLTEEMIRPETVVIDVGINRVGKRIVGDMTEGAFRKAWAATPVPGGVGPMTVAMLLKNTVKAAGI